MWKKNISNNWNYNIIDGNNCYIAKKNAITKNNNSKNIEPINKNINIKTNNNFVNNKIIYNTNNFKTMYILNQIKLLILKKV